MSWMLIVLYNLASHLGVSWETSIIHITHNHEIKCIVSRSPIYYESYSLKR